MGWIIKLMGVSKLRFWAISAVFERKASSARENSANLVEFEQFAGNCGDIGGESLQDRF